MILLCSSLAISLAIPPLVPCPLSHAQLRSTVTIESLHSNHLVLAITVMPPRSPAHVCPTPACPDAPASSTRHAYSSPRSRPPKTPHQESHTPAHVSLTLPSTPAPATTYLVKVEHQIQLAHVPEERIQHLDEEVYRLQVRQFVVVCIDARAEEQPCVSPIHDLGHVAEFDEVGLVLLVARRDQAVDLGVLDRHVGSRRRRCGGGNRVGRDRWRVQYLALELDLLFILRMLASLPSLGYAATYAVRRIPLRQSCFTPMQLVRKADPSGLHREVGDALPVLNQNEREHHLGRGIFSRRMGSTVVRDQDEDRLPAEGGGVRRTGTPGRGVQGGPLTTWSCRSRAIMTCFGLPISLPCADQTFLIILCDRASSSAAGSQTPCLRMGHVISCLLGDLAWCWSLPCTGLQSSISCTTCLI
jgi:hypothetical protein